jgi:uncharacterized protein (DUF427 family)
MVGIGSPGAGGGRPRRHVGFLFIDRAPRLLSILCLCRGRVASPARTILLQCNIRPHAGTAAARVVRWRMSSLPSSAFDDDSLDAVRGHWHWRGQARPAFAAAPRPGQESVWDYPRPPRLEVDRREVVVRWGEREVARSTRAIRALETAHPPSFYIPRSDIAAGLLEPAEGTSLCEWKGPARYWSLVDGARRLAKVAWSYPQPLPG